ncbi:MULTISPECIES: nitroreductase family deazaflavin-dependent oxidoreductase [Thermomonospora]|uniref:Deazaflavin-dependent oxidoreductase (Nitroreductase family) n=1 Tax=Thermomonospora cellulosilytica TaxID=1411118 RepID=A0A7W3MZE7_9ACTN|nr:MULTISPECIES: nitroreductase family deazaflavin-dependent oxidoreductase [Thermomonospora]MBA9004703.1 deazaflavin-dependent oxidoreductase (nitroreductase family) [Thermomonospora cellulosilytica]
MADLIRKILGPPLQRMSGARWFARVGPKVVPPVDRALHRITGGRVMLGRLVVPSLLLTTVGSVSGRPRQVPLACMPEPDGGWIVVGSNFGRERHPAWTTNLLKEPTATVGYQGRTVQVTAHLLDEGERAEIWPRLLEVWPVYDRYAERVERELRVFRLVPDPSG